MTSTDSILQLISEIHIPGFFITVDFLQIGEAIPQGISGFLKEKYDKISHGASGRKFIYQESRLAHGIYILSYRPGSR